MTSQFYNLRFRRILIFSFFLFFTFDGYTQVEFLGDFNTRENGSNPTFFKRYQDKILFFANQSIYSIDTLGGNLSLVADSVKFVNEELTPDPFVIHGGFIFYISNNNLWKTNLIQFTNLGIYNGPIHSFFFAGDMPIVIGNYGAYTPFNEQAASIPFQNNGYLIPIGGLNFFYLPFFEIYRDFIPQRVGNKLYCFVSLTNNSVINISSVRENSIGTSYLGKVDSLDSFVMSNYQQLNDFKSNLFKPVVTINNIVYFVVSKSVTSSTSRNELWKIDNDVLSKVSDFNPSNTSNQSGLTHRLYNLNGKIVILLSSNGVQELWVSDGTTGNISLLKTFKTNVLLDDTFATILDGRLFFSAAESDDFEVWETDGTVDNTKLFMDLDINGSSSPSRFIDFQGGFIFQTKSGSIWVSQGGLSNTLKLRTKLADLRIEKLEKNKFILEGKYIFGGYDDGVMGTEPTKFDMATKEVSNIANLNTSNEGFLYDLRFKYKLNNRYYFEGVFNKRKGIFSSDGTAEGTIRNTPQDIDLAAVEVQKGGNGLFVKEYFDGSFQYGFGFLNLNTNQYNRITLVKNDASMINPKQLFEFGNEVVFVNSNQSNELFISNGTNRPILLKDFEVNIESIFSKGSEIFCSANGLWVGDASNFIKLFNTSDINLPISVSHYLTMENKIYFFSKFRNTANQLRYGMFVSDGTRNGTMLIYTFEGVVIAQDFSFFVDQNSIFFALKYSNQTNVYRYENLFGQVTLLTTFDNVVQDSFSNFLKFSKLGNELYLQYNRNNRGFVSKINLVNSVLTIVNEGRQNFQYDMEVLNNVLYFRTTTDDFKYRLMRTDGTGIGTYIISTSFNNNPEFVPRLLMPFENKLLFFSELESLGAELFIYRPQLCESTINQSVKSGNWLDLETWSCGTLPNLTKDVIINPNHKVILHSNQIGEAKSIYTVLGSVLQIENGGQLIIKP